MASQITITNSTPEEIAAELVKNYQQNDPYLLVMVTKEGSLDKMRFGVRQAPDLVRALVYQAIAANRMKEIDVLLDQMQRMVTATRAIIEKEVAKKAKNN